MMQLLSCSFRLRLAVKRGKCEKVKQLIEKEVDINKQDVKGRTVLMNAAAKGHVDVARLLIDKGANINAQDKNGVTALMLASVYGGDIRLAEKVFSILMNYYWEDLEYGLPAMKGNLDMVKLLLQYKADVNLQDHKGKTALTVAVTTHNIDIAKELLHNNADANLTFTVELINLKGSVVRCLKGITPLIATCYFGYLEMAKVLLGHGADPNIKSEMDSPAYSEIFMATERKRRKEYSEIAKLLIKSGMDMKMTLYKKGTPLIRAADEGETELVDLCLQYGADINAQDEDGVTALMKAAEDLDKEHMEIVRSLIDNNADLEIQDNDKQTALMYACNRPAVGKVKLLLKHGALVDVKDKNGRTALMNTAADAVGFKEQERTEVVKALIENGANINLQDNDGKTALQLSSYSEIALALKQTEVK